MKFNQNNLSKVVFIININVNKRKTMNKKLLTTSALAGVVALAGTSFAELKIGGNLEYTYNAASSTSTIKSTNGQGFEENISISNSKDTDFGTLSYGFNLENGATEGPNLTLTNGDTTFQIGADSFANLSTSVIPNTGEAYQTVAGNVNGLAYKTAFDMGAGDGPGRKNGIGYALAQKVAGGSLSVRYVANTDQDNVSSAGDVGRTGGSSTRVIYSGSLGVEGLNVMAGWAQDDATGAKTQKGKAKTFGAAYNFGQITVGAQRKNYEPLDTVAAQDEYKVNEFGIGFAASDNLTLSVVHITTDGDKDGTDFANKEKITGVGIGYNLGGIAVELSYADVQDAGGVSGSDGDAFQFRTVQKF